jgi:hypothetical protein
MHDFQITHAHNTTKELVDGLAPCVALALGAAREEALLWSVARARGLSLLQATAAPG